MRTGFWEKAMAGVVLGVVAPILFLLVGWWGSIPLVPESEIWKYALAGLLFGMVVDAVTLRLCLQRLYQLHSVTLIGLYLFYTVGIFGFFMGVPLLNIVPGVVAGLYMGRRLRLQGTETKMVQALIHKTTLFTTGVMLMICVASAVFALLTPSTSADLQRMLHLGFEITRPMLLVLILLGGAGLVLSQYVLTHWAAHLGCAFSE